MLRFWSLAQVLAVLTGGCRTSAISGSGNIVSGPRVVEGFTGVAISGSGRLSIKHTGAESLTVTADDNILNYLTSEVRAGQLRLGVRPGVNVRPSQDIVYQVTVQSLSAIVLSGSASVVVTGVKSSRFETTVSGSGDIVASGIVDVQHVTISGSGSFHGEGLQSIVATIVISGSGNAVVAVSDRLDAVVTGSGSIEYIGTPTVTQQVTGSGSIRRR